jgi:hypothetical protein
MVKYETSDGSKWRQQYSLTCDLFDIEQYNKEFFLQATG